jgi:hypothetical protein
VAAALAFCGGLVTRALDDRVDAPRLVRPQPTITVGFDSLGLRVEILRPLTELISNLFRNCGSL